LKKKHGSSYETPKFCLLVRMMASNLRDDLHRQPPAFSGSTPKRPCRESLSDALSGAAVKGM